MAMNELPAYVTEANRVDYAEDRAAALARVATATDALRAARHAWNVAFAAANAARRDGDVATEATLRETFRAARATRTALLDAREHLSDCRAEVRGWNVMMGYALETDLPEVLAEVGA